MDSKYKSCLAIFSPLESPFLETANVQSYYHPSQAQSLTQEQRHMVLSPSRLQRRNCPTSEKAEALSPARSGFLQNSSYQEAKSTKSDSASPFNESWPSTERSSSTLTPEGAVSLPSEQALGTKSLPSPKSQDSVSDSESVIARYIERFRFGQPTNRRDRRANSETSAQFWWLGHSSVPEGNISKKEASPSQDSSQCQVRMSLFSPELDLSPLGSSQDTFAVDPETVSLQERAARLLQKSQIACSGNSDGPGQSMEKGPWEITFKGLGVLICYNKTSRMYGTKGAASVVTSEKWIIHKKVMSNKMGLVAWTLQFLQIWHSMSPSTRSRHVSSEGVGFTPTPSSTDAEADWVRCIPQDIAANQHKGGLTTLPYHITQRSQACSSLKPEEDILFQWRLRRKMEEASKAVTAMPSLAWKTQYNQITSASTMVKAAAPKSPEPSSCRSKSSNVFPVSEAQLGVKSTLDESQPCCCAGSVRKEPSSQQVRETAVFRNRTAMAGGLGFHEKQRLKESTPQQDSICTFTNSCYLPKPAPKEEQGGKKLNPQEERDFALPNSPLSAGYKRTRKPLSQSVLHQAHQTVSPDERPNVEPRGNGRPHRSRQNPEKPVRDSTEAPLSLAKHSVQHVLGEVVSERLFSPPESPVQDRHKPKRTSENWNPEQIVPSPVATPSHPQLLDMAGQLLEQAEDSDGTEFEDDPLLQVLRGQREVLRNQLRAVDVRMGQLEVYNSDQNISCE